MTKEYSRLEGMTIASFSRPALRPADREESIMEYRLTFHSVGVGSLTFCLAILLMAWIRDVLGPIATRLARASTRNHNQPGDRGDRSPVRVPRTVSGIYTVEAIDAYNALATEPRGSRREEVGSVPRRWVG